MLTGPLDTATAKFSKFCPEISRNLWFGKNAKSVVYGTILSKWILDMECRTQQKTENESETVLMQVLNFRDCSRNFLEFFFLQKNANSVGNEIFQWEQM